MRSSCIKTSKAICSRSLVLDLDLRACPLPYMKQNAMSAPTIIEAVIKKKKAGSTLKIMGHIRPPASEPLPPVDLNSEEVLGGVESDEALSSVRLHTTENTE
jgi:hypothetical protein